ncbi:MAG: hypothetical protein KI791_20925 [Cyclobacteriaceae bacterium]|nr:hypothetical protein [Cyclobacteriaceae bacterium SS2]
MLGGIDCMTKKLLNILLIATTVLAYGQSTEDSTGVIYSLIGELSDEQLNNSGAIKLTFANDRNEAQQLANEDITKGIPFLLLAGGISPVVIATDPKFEQKYGIYFYDYGCTGPEHDFIIAYNNVIFEHLTEQYGKRWFKEVRKDVVGLKDWKKSK